MGALNQQVTAWQKGSRCRRWAGVPEERRRCRQRGRVFLRWKFQTQRRVGRRFPPHWRPPGAEIRWKGKYAMCLRQELLHPAKPGLRMDGTQCRSACRRPCCRDHLHWSLFAR
jgi:hypothetical protein